MRRRLFSPLFGAYPFILVSLIFSAHALSAPVTSPALETATPAAAGLSKITLEGVDEVMAQAMAEGKLPGAVVLIGRHGKIAFKKAYGRRALQPRPAAMTTDTIFDLASLTKVVATAPSVLWLAERGLVGLNDPVSKYLPEFAQHGKERVTVHDLLTHYSGLMPDNPVRDYTVNAQTALARVCELDLVAAPGTKFIYSDVNYILLAEIVRRVTGHPLDVFARKVIFEPLGMATTGFNPPAALRRRCAPTIRRNGQWLTGRVHDVRAALLDGVAGHAGLFSTADDLARFAQMILNKGSLNGRTVLQPGTVEMMTTAYAPPGGVIQRGLGWDFNSPFAVARGRRFSAQSFGHTGYTGTSIWIDPPSQTFLIILSNCVHPKGKSRIKQVRGEVADVVAAAIQDTAPAQGAVAAVSSK